MKRYCKFTPQALTGKLFYLRNKAAGGNGNMPVAYAYSV